MSVAVSQVLARLSSPRWLRIKVRETTRDFVQSLIPFTPNIIQRDVAGEKHSFYIGSSVGRRWYGQPIDACEEMQFVKHKLIKPGSLVLECGAHHGAHTILLSRWVGNKGRVIAVEPMPENLVILRRNIELNRLTNVTVVDKLVGARCGFFTMIHKSNSAVSDGLRKDTIEVEGTTIDQIAHQFGVPSLVTIDVEGFECHVLEGGRRTLAAVPALSMEVHTLRLPYYGKTFNDIWNLIDRSQYDVFIQRDNAEAPVLYSPDSIPRNRVLLFLRPKGCSEENHRRLR
jgi:FkbM family methyltransferase